MAITRAKENCMLSYSLQSHKGSEEALASIIEALPDGTFAFTNSTDTEKKIMEAGPQVFVESQKVESSPLTRAELRELVAKEYSSLKVSVTLLNSFFDCPWKWYFRNFLRVPEPLSESLLFGSIVHGAIETVIKLSDSRSPEYKKIDDTVMTEAIKEQIQKS